MQTKISTKGQVVLPKAIRDRRRWKAGTLLTVEERPDGVLLFPVKAPDRTSLAELRRDHAARRDAIEATRQLVLPFRAPGTRERRDD